VAIAAALLLGYWALNLFLVAPDNPTAGVFTPQGNIGCWLDRTLLAPLGRISPGTAALPFENQSLLGNMTATVTAMLGMFTGEFVRTMRDRLSGNRRAGILVLAALALAAVGWFIAHGCGRWSFPVSKPLWSPSFTLIVGGYSVAMFALFHWLIDVKGWWRHTLFFRVIGLNAITIYIAQPLFGLGRTSELLFGRLARLALEREALLSTRMEDGSAVPHVRGVEGGSLAFALGVSKKGFKYDAAGTMVHLVFFSVIPVAVSPFYMRLMAVLAEAFAKEFNRAALLEAKSPAELWKAFMKTTRHAVH
jgi:predicted acyltransferase